MPKKIRYELELMRNGCASSSVSAEKNAQRAGVVTSPAPSDTIFVDRAGRRRYHCGAGEEEIPDNSPRACYGSGRSITRSAGRIVAPAPCVAVRGEGAVRSEATAMLANRC